LKEDGSVAAVKTGVTQTLQPGQESAFAQTVDVAYTPHGEPSTITSVEVVPLIQP
jgi:hypothetical protein